MIEHSSDIVSILDTSGVAIYESPAVERVLGYGRDELVGRNVFELIHPDDLPAVVEVFRQAMAEDEPTPSLSPPYRFLHRDGTWRWLESAGTNLCADPEIGGLVINSRDVTERQEAEAALRRSEARFRTLFDCAAIGVALLDTSGRPVHINHALREMLGYSQDELSLLVFTEFTHPDDREVDWELFTELMRGERSSYRLEKRFIRKDGRIVWGRLTASIVRGADGEPDLLIGMVEDATDQKRAEQRSMAFQELGQILNTATTPDEAARIVLKVADSLLGWDACWLDLFRQDGTGQSNLVLIDTIDGEKRDVPHPPGSNGPSPLVARVLREGPVLILHPRDALPAADAGGIVPFGNQQSSASLLCVPIRSGPRVIGLLSIQSYQFDAYDGEDLTVLQALADYCAGALERTQAEAARHALEQQLLQAQRMEAVGRLAGGVAHDFNNMLAVINGYSDLLLMNTPAGSSVHANLEQIRHAGERASRLTQQLLAFSRKQIVQLRTIHLEEAIGGVDRMLRRLIGEDIELVTLTEPGLSPVRADLGQLEQVLFNLAVNARDAMPRGGKLVIHARNAVVGTEVAERIPGVGAGSYVLLSVADTGCGMTADTLEHIFEPFFTTKEPGKGTGLGLATVYGIVNQNGGFIQVESAPAKGSTFRIYLPSLEPHAAHGDSSQPTQPVPAAGHETVLLVEDEAMVRSLARHLLETSGYHVLEAEHGEQAIRLAESYSGPIDLLLVDVVMPHMSGRELAERITTGRPETRVLFMSGYTDDAVIRHGVNHAHTAFLQKPFTPASLTREVRRVLTGS